MTDPAAAYPAPVRAELAVLPPAALAAAVAVLPYVHGLDDQIEVCHEAWRLVAEGRDAIAATRWLRSARKREERDMRRAGRAVDAATEPWLLGDAALDLQDPAAALLAKEAAVAYRDAAFAAGWQTPAAPATVGKETALPVVLAARECRRCLRTIQTKMRGVCHVEQAGQGVLPGVPAAAEVYRARALEGVT